MNSRFRTAKPLQNHTCVLLTNRWSIEKLMPLKTGPYLIIEKPTGATYILQDQKKERITIHRNHIVTYFLKEKHIKEELHNYLLNNDIPTLKQPTKTIIKNTNINKEATDHKTETIYPESQTTYNLRKRSAKIR